MLFRSCRIVLSGHDQCGDFHMRFRGSQRNELFDRFKISGYIILTSSHGYNRGIPWRQCKNSLLFSGHISLSGYDIAAMTGFSADELCSMDCADAPDPCQQKVDA